MKQKRDKKLGDWLKLYAPSIKWGILIAILLAQMLVMIRIEHLEKEHNFLTDRINSVESNLTDQLEVYRMEDAEDD